MMNIRVQQRFVGNSCGQVTVEFVVILAAFLVIALVLGVVWRALEEGLLVDHALQSASHHIETVVPGVISDVFLY
ncbi:MAG: hypothetical protein RR671_02820 [Raoultibacter sp.]